MVFTRVELLVESVLDIVCDEGSGNSVRGNPEDLESLELSFHSGGCQLVIFYPSHVSYLSTIMTIKRLYALRRGLLFNSSFKGVNLLISNISEVSIEDLVFTSYVGQTLYGPMARYRDSSTSRVYPESVIIMLSKENPEIAKSVR